MVDVKNCLIVTALVAQWLMAVLTMALFLDPNLCALLSAILLFVDADLVLQRVRDEQRWVSYQRGIVRRCEPVPADIDLARERGD